MGRIMRRIGTGSATQRVELGGTFGSTVVLSIPANTYNTYALALTALETAYNALSNENKMRAKITRGDDIIYNNQKIDDKYFAYSFNSADTVYFQTFDLKNKKFTVSTATSQGWAFNDYSSIAQSAKLELIIV